MKLKDYTSNLLLGVFFLREELHAYVDILESQRFQLQDYLGDGTVGKLLENKKVMLSLAESKFAKLLDGSLYDADLFYPPKEMWLKEFARHQGALTGSIKRRLLEFDRKTMAWCYIYLIDEGIDVYHTAFFLIIIQYAKSGVDLLQSEPKK